MTSFALKALFSYEKLKGLFLVSGPFCTI